MGEGKGASVSTCHSDCVLLCFCYSVFVLSVVVLILWYRVCRV